MKSRGLKIGDRASIKKTGVNDQHANKEKSKRKGTSLQQQEKTHKDKRANAESKLTGCPLSLYIFKYIEGLGFKDGRTI